VVSDAEAVAARILEIAKLTWQHMLNPTSDLPITHDFYLKLWALSKPVINADLVMLDEGQDANGLLLKILEEQQCQVIYVGDQYQQLYSWRGAVNAMQRVKTPNVASLTQSFRFGPAIAEVANEVLVKMLGSERQIRGNPAKASRVESVRNPKAILCRTNAECIRQVIAAIDDGRRVGLQGGTADFKLTIQGIEDLKRGRVPYAPTLSLFISYDQLVEFSKSDLGRDLQTAIKLADEYGGQELLRLIEKLESSKESKPDIIISTGHKAKGLEWETVRLGSDFRGSDSKGYKDEDANLLYVAVTRAIGTLDLSLCDAIDQLRESKPSRATMPEDDSVIVLTREALAGIYEKPSARIEPILEVGPTSDGQAELGLMRTTVELQPSHPGFDGLTQNDPSIVQKNPGQGSQARRRQLEGARADAARDFLLRAKRDGRDQILKSSAGDAWGGLEQADTEDALNTWMERFLSEPGRQRMMATLRQAAFAANMKKVDLKSTVANRLSQAAREKGVSISDYIEQLLEIQGSGLPVSPGETSQGDRELSLQSY
jgi:macrodomain Ter protein organizer (MatP/YcbG family)